MKLQTNIRPYNTIGVVHHITMDQFEFEYLRSSIMSTTAMINFTETINEFKCDAFVDKKFVAIITPDDCEKPNHKMSFFFFGKVAPKYIEKYNDSIEEQMSQWSDDRPLPKSPVVCVYCANTDRFRKIEHTVVISEAEEKNFVIEGPAILDRNGICAMFGGSHMDYYGTTRAEMRLLRIISTGCSI